MVRPASTVIGAFCLLEMAHAMIWSGPQVTPAGLVAVDGVSPRPTQAPGWDGLPVELRKRGAGQYVYPPPPNWCGFINGHYDTVLSCSTDYTCAFSERVFGCCTGPAEECGIYTACVDQIWCDENCPADTQVLKCTENSLAWCGTYSIWGGTLNYNCGSIIRSISVELLSDFYGSLGSTLTNGVGSSPSKTIKSQPSVDSNINYGRSTSSTGALFPKTTSTGPAVVTTTPIPDDSALGAAAIGGIAVGAGIVLVGVAAGIIFVCCYRQRRKRRHRKDHQNTVAQALMPRPLATFDSTQAPQQGIGQPEKPYGAVEPPAYVNPAQSPYTDHAGGSPPPMQPYDPSQELTHRASTVSTAVSPNPLHYEDSATHAPSPETSSGYFRPAPPHGYSELSQGGGIPMQLRAGSPPSQIYTSVHEVPAPNRRPEGERWELSDRS